MSKAKLRKLNLPRVRTPKPTVRFADRLAKLDRDWRKTLRESQVRELSHDHTRLTF